MPLLLLQISQLVHLQRAYFGFIGCPPEDWEPLQRLASCLTRLRLHGGSHVGSGHVPPGLSQLTALRDLSLLSDRGGASRIRGGEVVLAALPRLTRLTHVELTPLLGMPSPPAALASLPALQTFLWADPLGAASANAQLPPGSWLTRLQALGAPYPLLDRSLPALAAAQELRQLVVCKASGGEQSEALSSVLCWALGCPSLQRLMLDLGDSVTLPVDVLLTLFEAGRDPELSVETCKDMLLAFYYR